MKGIALAIVIVGLLLWDAAMITKFGTSHYEGYEALAKIMLTCMGAFIFVLILERNRK